MFTFLIEQLVAEVGVNNSSVVYYWYNVLALSKYSLSIICRSLHIPFYVNYFTKLSLWLKSYEVLQRAVSLNKAPTLYPIIFVCSIRDDMHAAGTALDELDVLRSPCPNHALFVMEPAIWLWSWLLTQSGIYTALSWPAPMRRSFICQESTTL